MEESKDTVEEFLQPPVEYKKTEENVIPQPPIKKAAAVDMFPETKFAQASEIIHKEPTQNTSYPLGCQVWTPCPAHSGISFTACRSCKTNIIRDANQVQFLSNGDAVVSLRLCRDCIHLAIDLQRCV